MRWSDSGGGGAADIGAALRMDGRVLVVECNRDRGRSETCGVFFSSKFNQSY